MSWRLSRYRAGELVEVRSQEEILGTLDSSGCLDGMPFMPEMLKYCGQQMRVGVVAHKSCDTVRKTWTGRRVQSAVHLENVRCDGAAHDGCQADCNIYWKDAWLKPVSGARGGSKGSLATARARQPGTASSCSMQGLCANTRVPAGSAEAGALYSCQATRLYEASEPLPWWDLRQFAFDVSTGNYSARRVCTVLWLFALRWVVQHTPFAFRLLKRLSDSAHERLTGRPAPQIAGKIKRGERTPTGTLGLQRGERVRIRPLAQIEQTLDTGQSNRGMFFDYEMVPFCGGEFSVRDRVTRIIDESTGKMLQMKEPCITLEGVVCKSQYNACRLLCPRAIRPYWREIWLERVDADRPA